MSGCLSLCLCVCVRAPIVPHYSRVCLPHCSARTVVSADEIALILDEAGVPPCVSLREQARFHRLARPLVDPSLSSPTHVSDICENIYTVLVFSCCYRGLALFSRWFCACSFYGKRSEACIRVHTGNSACRSCVTPASLDVSHCSGEALTSPACHACGCASPFFMCSFVLRIFHLYHH